MPIRPEFRHFYGRQWREKIRPRILARAKNKCELCGKPNGDLVYVVRSYLGQWWTITGEEWIHAYTTTRLRPKSIKQGLWKTGEARRRIRVVLTVAHLNHTPGDDRDENLKALCQWCHLNYDREHHHETRAERKDRARPLLQLSEASPTAAPGADPP